MTLSSILKASSLCILAFLSVSILAVPAPAQTSSLPHGIISYVGSDNYTHYRNTTGAVNEIFNGKPAGHIALLPPNSPGAKKLKLHKRNNDCGASSFIDYSSGGSPYVSDCQCIEDYAYANPMEFGFAAQPAWYDLIWCGTCVFGVETNDVLESYVGNEDIGDLIGSSINDFSWFGLVGAQGYMGCIREWPLPGDSLVGWAIFHS
jgi:hypothetical protein